jgi:probable rRNA maturation factor
MSKSPHIEVVVSADAWRQVANAESAIVRAIQAAANQIEDVAESEIAVLLTDDAGIRDLNRRWRGFDKPTNVLSFPAPAQSTPDAPQMLGDIAIAFETTQREASDEHKPFSDHLSHLAIHGFLHLVGYDHESDDDAEEMEQFERDILAGLGIRDPYAEHPPVD